MTYLDRIKLELQDITFNDEELTVLAQENGITNPTSEYDPTSNTAKRAIYSTVLSVLEAIANNPKTPGYFWPNRRLKIDPIAGLLSPVFV